MPASRHESTLASIEGQSTGGPREAQPRLLRRASRMMKKGVESFGAQAAQAKEATSTGANVLEIPEPGAQEPTPAWAEMSVADPTITFSAAC